MRNRQKNGGYVLPYALAVIAIVGVLVTVCLTSAQRGLEAQNASVARMRDRCAAEGLIEQYLATKAETPPDGVTIVPGADGQTITAISGSVTIVAVPREGGGFKSYEVTGTEGGT